MHFSEFTEITVEEVSPVDEVGSPEERAFYQNHAILGTLIGVSVLVVSVIFFVTLLAYRKGYVDFKNVDGKSLSS